MVVDVSALKHQYAWKFFFTFFYIWNNHTYMVCRKQDYGFYESGKGHCGGSNFVIFYVN
jgi:hypothetical protein